MTSNKKILLFSLMALSTLCIQKNVNATKGFQKGRSIKKNKKKLLKKAMEKRQIEHRKVIEYKRNNK